MDYSMLDIIESLIDIERKAIQIYETISINKDVSLKLQTIVNILITEEKRHIEYYEEMKIRLMDNSEFIITIEVYNKISSLFFEYKKLIGGISARNINELLDYALSLENINVSLLKQVQEAFVGRNFDKHKKSYEMVSEMVDQEVKHISNLKLFMK